MNQDYIAWVGQGAIADRTLEHLGESDRGVIMMRKRLLEEIGGGGGRPRPEGHHPRSGLNDRVYLPTRRPNRPAPSDGPQPFVFLAGQPDEVFAEYAKAWQRARLLPKGPVTVSSCHRYE